MEPKAVRSEGSGPVVDPLLPPFKFGARSLGPMVSDGFGIARVIYPVGLPFKVLQRYPFELSGLIGREAAGWTGKKMRKVMEAHKVLWSWHDANGYDFWPAAPWFKDGQEWVDAKRRVSEHLGYAG